MSRIRWGISPFALFFGAFVIYDMTASVERVWQHPSDIDLLVASLGTVALAVAASAGFYLAQSTRATGLDDLLALSQQGSGPLLLRLGLKAVFPFVWIPVLLHLFYLVLTQAVLRDWHWLIYIGFVPVQAVVGFLLGLIIGRLLSQLWSPRSTGLAYVFASLFGIGLFFAIISAPTPRDPSSALNLGLVSVAIPADVRFNPLVILWQEALAAGLAIFLAGSLLAMAARAPRAAFAGVVCVMGGGILSTQAMASSSMPVTESVPPTHCVGKSSVVCSVPLEARGAGLLADDLSAIASTVPEVVPRRVVQGRVAADGTETVNVLRLPGDRQASARYAGEVILKAAGCSGLDGGRSLDLEGLFTGLEQWLLGDRGAMDPRLRSTLSSLSETCRT